jgi:hypothetical protein
VFFARDTARGITPKRRASARLFPLFIKHQISYIKHVLMDPFSYLSVLISIILALGMTRVLADVGEMLQARSRRRLYWVHAIWVVNLFLYLVVAWWIFYRWRNQQPWTFFLFIFVLISPTILYLALSFFFRPSLLWMSSSITKRTITPTIAYSSFSSQYSRRSISSIPC